MYRIGEVSKFTSVPAKTLRYWESVGLISPKKVDEHTSYRFYDDESIERINQIKYLKQLGLSLAEIKNFNITSLDSKIKELFNESASKKASALELLNIQARGVLTCQNFENDPDAIGHWKLIGVTRSKEMAVNGTFKSAAFLVKDLYLMPNGMEYYIIKWTKGKIAFNEDWFTYEIVGDRLIVTLTYGGVFDSFVVYQRIDRKEHEIKDFIILDDIDKPFVRDKEAEGVFNYVSSVFAPSIDAVNLGNLRKMGGGFLGLYIMADGTVIWRVKDAYVKLSDRFYTKDYICSHNNLSDSDTKGVAMKYILKEFNGKTYMIMEWKDASYLFANSISYVVLEKCE